MKIELLIEASTFNVGDTVYDAQHRMKTRISNITNNIARLDNGNLYHVTKLVGANPDDMARNALEDVYSEIRRGMRMAFSDDLEPIEPGRRGGFVFAVRYFGNWVNPPDAEDAEDDEDYDWQVLTDASAKAIDDMVGRYQRKYPNVKLSWHTGEKNWIYFDVK